MAIMTKTKTPTPVATNGATPPRSEYVETPRIDLQHILLTLRGTSPLIVHKWSEKAKKAMLDKQQKKASTGRVAKNPQQDFEDALYRTADGSYGFPAVAFKAAAVRAGLYAEMKMTYLRGAFHVEGELVVIEGTPRPREDMVKVGQGTADLRYRPEFPEWETTLRIVFNARAITTEQIVNLFNVAGFAVGVGEWRPERDGQYGRFEVVSG